MDDNDLESSYSHEDDFTFRTVSERGTIVPVYTRVTVIIIAQGWLI